MLTGDSTTKNAVIVGAGFGGLDAAKRLGDQEGVSVVLIDRRNHHLFQPLLYQVAMAGLSPGEIAVPIRTVMSRYKNNQGARVTRLISESLLSILAHLSSDIRRLIYENL